MKRVLIAAWVTLLFIPAAGAVTEAEDIATTIKLRGYDCGGRAVHAISQSEDARGNSTIRATCPNGIRYQIVVTSDGRMRVTPLN